MQGRWWTMGGEDYTLEPRWRAKLLGAMYEASAIQERLALARCHGASEGMRKNWNSVVKEQLAVESVGVVVRRGRTGSRKCLGCRRHCSSLDKWRAPAQEQEAWAPCHASQPPNTNPHAPGYHSLHHIEVQRSLYIEHSFMRMVS